MVPSLLSVRSPGILDSAAGNVGQKLTSPSRSRISFPYGRVDKEVCFQVRYRLATLLFDCLRRDTTVEVVVSLRCLSMAENG